MRLKKPATTTLPRPQCRQHGEARPVGLAERHRVQQPDHPAQRHRHRLRLHRRPPVQQNPADAEGNLAGYGSRAEQQTAPAGPGL